MSTCHPQLCPEVVEYKLCKAMGGMKWLVAGIDDSGKLVEPDCLMQELIELHTTGRAIELPDGKGGKKTWRLKVFSGPWSADWLAKQALLPFAESTQADQCCSDCKWLSLAARRRLRKTAEGPPPKAAAPKPEAAAARKKPETEAARRKRETAQKLRDAAARGRAVAAKRHLQSLPTNPLEAAGRLVTALSYFATCVCLTELLCD